MNIGPKDSVMVLTHDGRINISIAENPKTETEIKQGTIIMGLSMLLAEGSDKLAKLIDNRINEMNNG